MRDRRYLSERSRIYVTQLIAQGSQLNIAVPMEDWKDNLELVGEAVWVKPVEKGKGFWVGLELRDSNRENMQKWFKVVHSLLVPLRRIDFDRYRDRFKRRSFTLGSVFLLASTFASG